MRRGRAISGLVVVVALAASLSLGAGRARADGGRPTVASDAFWVGVRFGPDAALLAGYDLDVYVTDDRALSIGPGATISVLGKNAAFGQAQDFQLVVDVVRFKVQLNEAGEDWRPYFFFGGGFDYVALRAATETVEVTPEGVMPMPVAGAHVLPELREFQGIFSMGFGADLFTGGAWALTAMLNNHFRLSGTTRVPVVWLDFAIGLRFGI